MYESVLVITDQQHAPKKPLWHMDLIGRLAIDYEPPLVVQMGDWNDCSALGHWEKGTMLAWEKHHQKDCDHSRDALDVLEQYLSYGPRKIALGGNHDGMETSRDSRLERYVRKNPELKGSLECPMQCHRDHGWEVVPYLKRITVDGITYSHLFSVKADGKALMKTGMGATTAMTQLSGVGNSCVAGHKQGFDMANRPFNGKMQQAVIAGSGYPQRMGYQGEQGNDYWRGVLLLNVYKKGQFDVDQWSLERLRKVYG